MLYLYFYMPALLRQCLAKAQDVPVEDRVSWADDALT